MVKVGDRVNEKFFGFGLGKVVEVDGTKFLVKFDNKKEGLHDGQMLKFKGGKDNMYWYFNIHQIKKGNILVVKSPSLVDKIKSFLKGLIKR